MSGRPERLRRRTMFADGTPFEESQQSPTQSKRQKYDVQPAMKTPANNSTTKVTSPAAAREKDQISTPAPDKRVCGNGLSRNLRSTKGSLEAGISLPTAPIKAAQQPKERKDGFPLSTATNHVVEQPKTDAEKNENHGQVGNSKKKSENLQEPPVDFKPSVLNFLAVADMNIESNITIRNALVSLVKIAKTHKVSEKCCQELMGFISSFVPHAKLFTDLNDTMMNDLLHPAFPAAKINSLIFDASPESPPAIHVQMDIAQALKHMFEHHHLYKLLINKYTEIPSDVINSECYKSLPRVSPTDMSLIHHMTYKTLPDGLTLVASFLSIAELEPHVRKDFIILESMWLIPQNIKQITNEKMLGPFCDALTTLGTTGFIWTHPKSSNSKAVMCSKAFLLFSTVPLKLRSYMQNLGYLNLYGCGTCEKEFDSKLGYLEDNDQKKNNLPHIRSHWDVLRQSFDVQRLDNKIKSGSFDFEFAVMQDEEIDCLKSHKGSRGFSPLIYTPNFNIVDGFAPEYVKNVLYDWVHPMLRKLLSKTEIKLEVTKGKEDELVSSWSKNPDTDMFFKNHLPEPDLEVAKNLRSWLLYFALPTLNGILSEEQLSDLALLVKAIYNLLKDEIKDPEFEDADKALKEYSKKVSKALVGQVDIFTSLALHSLTHLPRGVLKCGALWGSSAFPYLDSVKFICEKVTSLEEGKDTKEVLLEASTSYNELLTLKVVGRSSSSKPAECRFYGEAIKFEALDKDISKLLSEIPDVSFSQGSVFYTKGVIMGVEYASDWYSKNNLNRKLFQYSIDGSDPEVAKLLFFCQDLDGNELFVANSVKLMEPEFGNKDLGLMVDHIRRYTETEQMIIGDITDMDRPIWLVGPYLCIPPNTQELYLEA